MFGVAFAARLPLWRGGIGFDEGRGVRRAVFQLRDAGEGSREVRLQGRDLLPERRILRLQCGDLLSRCHATGDSNKCALTVYPKSEHLPSNAEAWAITIRGPAMQQSTAEAGATRPIPS